MKNPCKKYRMALVLSILTVIFCQPRALAQIHLPLRNAIAVIDTGIDVSHPNLKNHLWTNPGESGIDTEGRDKSSNGIDDDHNGYVDDVHGWNFVENSNDLTDHHGHGTHIAGIIRQIDSDAQIAVLKYFDPQVPVQNNISSLIEALRYSVKMGFVIINYSGGGADPNLHELETLKHAEKKGILVIAAAGNEASNSDEKKFFPAGYDLSNILSVGSVNKSGILLPSSNYGTHSVHIAALGDRVLSSLPGGTEGLMTGTSQATAVVSAAAHLILRQRPDLSAQEVIKVIKSSALRNPALDRMIQSSGVVSPQRALQMQDSGRSWTGYRLGKGPKIR